MTVDFFTNDYNEDFIISFEVSRFPTESELSKIDSAIDKEYKRIDEKGGGLSMKERQKFCTKLAEKYLKLKHDNESHYFLYF